MVAVGRVYATTTATTCCRGVEQDHNEAVHWVRRAAQQGNVTGQHNLGLMFTQGLDVEQDYIEAATWFRHAAMRGHTDSQVGLGQLYE